MIQKALELSEEVTELKLKLIRYKAVVEEAKAACKRKQDAGGSYGHLRKLHKLLTALEADGHE